MFTKKTSRQSLLTAAVLSSVGVLGLAQSANAAVIYWNNAGTAWATGTNWAGNVAPANDLTTDIAGFNSAAYANQPNAGTRSVAGIQVDATSTAALTISGTNLSIGASGVTIANGAAAVTIQPTTVTLSATQAWTNSSTNALTIGTANFALGSNNITFTGNIGGNLGTVTGTGGITINGAGRWVFGTAGNNYSGGTTLSGGAFVQIGQNSTGTYPSVTSGPFGTGTLTLNGSNIEVTGGYTLGNAIVFAGGTNIFAYNNNNQGNQTWNGPITVSANSTYISNNEAYNGNYRALYTHMNGLVTLGANLTLGNTLGTNNPGSPPFTTATRPGGVNGDNSDVTQYNFNGGLSGSGNLIINSGNPDGTAYQSTNTTGNGNKAPITSINADSPNFTGAVIATSGDLRLNNSLPNATLVVNGISNLSHGNVTVGGYVYNSGSFSTSNTVTVNKFIGGTGTIANFNGLTNTGAGVQGGDPTGAWGTAGVGKLGTVTITPTYTLNSGGSFYVNVDRISGSLASNKAAFTTLNLSTVLNSLIGVVNTGVTPVNGETVDFATGTTITNFNAGNWSVAAIPAANVAGAVNWTGNTNLTWGTGTNWDLQSYGGTVSNPSGKLRLTFNGTFGNVSPVAGSSVIISTGSPSVTGPTIATTVANLTLGNGSTTPTLTLQSGGNLNVLGTTLINAGSSLVASNAGLITTVLTLSNGSATLGNASTAVTTANVPTGTLTFNTGGTITTLNASGGTANLNGGTVTTLSQTAGSAVLNGGTATNANVSGGTFTLTTGSVGTLTNSSAGTSALNGGTVTTLAFNGGTGTIGGGTVTTANVAANGLTLNSGAIGTANINGGGITTTGGTITTLNHNSGAVTSTIGSGTTVTTTTIAAGTVNFNSTQSGNTTLTLPAASTGTAVFGSGAKVGTANFSFGFGTANAGTNALTITNQMKLAGNYTAFATSGTFTAAGSNLAASNPTETLTISSGGTLTLGGAVSSAPNFRYFKFNITANNGDGYNQLSELHYFQSGTWLQATARSGNFTGDGGLAALEDNNSGTKGGHSGNPSTIIYDFGSAQTLTSYNWATANDSTPGRNPKNWTVEGSNDNVSYSVVDTKTNYSGPSSTFTWAANNSTNFNAMVTGQSDANGSQYAFTMGSLTQTGGTVSLSNTKIATAAAATLDLAGAAGASQLGGLDLNGNLGIQNVAAAGSVTFNGNVTGLATSTVSLAAGAGSTPSLILAGSTIKTAASTILTLPAHTLSAATTSIGDVSNTGTVIFSGNVITAASKALTIDGGTLKINGTYNSTSLSSNTLAVNSGGTLGGTGTIHAGVTINSGGHYAPGNSVGTSTPDTLTLNAGSINDWEFNSTPANDKIFVANSGGFALNGTGGSKVGFNLYTEGGVTPWTTNGTYDLIRYLGSVGGTDTSAANLSVLNAQVGKAYTFLLAAHDSFNWLQLNIANSTSATTYTLGVSSGTVNLLKGGTTSAGNSVITNTGTGTADTLNFTNLSASSNNGNATVSGTLASGGPLANTNGSASQALTLTGAAYGSSTITAIIGSATNVTLNTAASISGSAGTFTVNVGNATADKTNSRASFTGTVLTAPVALNASYAGLASKVNAETAGGGSVNLGTEAILLQGKNSTGSGETVSMTWRTRNTNEVYPSPNGGPFTTTKQGLLSDVVRLTGMSNNGTAQPNGTVQTDPFALQMSYSQTAFAATGWGTSNLAIGWLDNVDTTYNNSNDVWRPATLGNFPGVGLGTNVILGYIGDPDGPGGNAPGSWANFVAQYSVTDANLGTFLGSTGIDTADNVVWAVLNHNSDFAVIPEPASLGLLALGGLALIGRRRRA